MAVHLLWADPARESIFADCLRSLAAGDALVLGGDAVRALESGSTRLRQLSMPAAGVEVHALARDCERLGIAIPAFAQATTPTGLVALVCAHARSISWF